MVDVRALPSEDLKLETLLSREKITHGAHYSDFVIPPGLRSPKKESCFELQNTSMHNNSKHFNGLFFIVITIYRPRKERQPRYCPEEILYERVQSILMF